MATPNGFGRRVFLASAAATAGAAMLSPSAQAVTAWNGRPARRGNRELLQRRFTDWRFGMFLHFNMGTFHDAEWVDPNQDPLSFAPSDLDCGQWADAAKAAGMRFAVLTVKHHDGFCLWPSKHTAYDVMSSSYRHDVVREYVDAFRAGSLRACTSRSGTGRTVSAPR
jgi:alpha-L-fucosidase